MFLASYVIHTIYPSIHTNKSGSNWDYRKAMLAGKGTWESDILTLNMYIYNDGECNVHSNLQLIGYH